MSMAVSLTLAKILMRKGVVCKSLAIMLVAAMLSSAYSSLGFLKWEMLRLAGRGANPGICVVTGKEHLQGPAMLCARLAWCNASGSTTALLIDTKNPVLLVKLSRGRVLMGPLGQSGAYIGYELAKKAGISVGKKIALTVANQKLVVRVSAIVRFNGPFDLSIIVRNVEVPGSKSICWIKCPHSGSASTAGGGIAGSAYAYVMSLNKEMASLLNAWALASLLLVMAAAYLLALSIIESARTDAYILLLIGASYRDVSLALLLYALSACTIGVIVGCALGLVASQVVAGCLKWIGAAVIFTPLLAPGDALKLVVALMLSSLVGIAVAMPRVRVEPEELGYGLG